jgi:hypothetical protein
MFEIVVASKAKQSSGFDIIKNSIKAAGLLRRCARNDDYFKKKLYHTKEC